MYLDNLVVMVEVCVIYVFDLMMNKCKGYS